MGEQGALRSAAKASLDRIARDREGASAEVRRLLDDLAEHLFDPGYGVEDLKRACGDHATQALSAFRAQLGRPDTYIAEARLATAMLLLGRTDWPITRISEEVGYVEPSRFVNACKRRFNSTPIQFRAAAGRWAPEGRLGESTVRRRRAATRQLRFSAETASPVAEEERARIRQAVAEELRRYLATHTHERQLDLLGHTVLFGGPELFELLSRESKVKGRHDRDQGIRLAELALATVEGSRPLLGQDYADLHALALARLGNALRLAGDLVGAEKLFQRSEEDWTTPGAGRNKPAEAEILGLKASLRLFQRRFSEARKLLGAAIEAAERTDDITSQANARLQRAALARYEGRNSAVITDLRAVAALLHRQEEPDLLQALGLSQDLAVAYLEIGEIDRAEAELHRANSLCGKLDHAASSYQLRWIDALIAKARKEWRRAERSFRQAKAGFDEIGDNYAVAMAALEIAILCQQQGRNSEVVALTTTEVIPILDTLVLRGEVLRVLPLLQKAVGANEVPLPVLEATRTALHAIVRDPARVPQHQGT